MIDENGIDWAAYDRYYGREDAPMPHDGAELAAAFYWLMEFVGAHGDEDWLHDEVWDSVYEARVSEEMQDTAYDEIYEQLKADYKGRPHVCLMTIGKEVAWKQAQPAIAVGRFARRLNLTLTGGSKASENTCGESA